MEEKIINKHISMNNKVPSYGVETMKNFFNFVYDDIEYDIKSTFLLCINLFSHFSRDRNKIDFSHFDYM